jgi:hypothetical protein
LGDKLSGIQGHRRADFVGSTDWQERYREQAEQSRRIAEAAEATE